MRYINNNFIIDLDVIYGSISTRISAPTVPTVDCGDPVVPNHGTVTLTNGLTTVGATAHQACNTGYDISGIADISCGASGSWNAAPVTCSLKSN